MDILPQITDKICNTIFWCHVIDVLEPIIAIGIFMIISAGIVSGLALFGIINIKELGK